jgi:hypothetical protein
VDLPGGQTLLAPTVTTNDEGGVVRGEMETLAETVYRRLGVTRKIESETLGDRARVVEFISELTSEPIVLDCSAPEMARECPLLVRFRDVGDPRTVEAVDPEDLSASFGPGVSLRRLLFELTSDEPEFTLANRLPWLSYPETSLNPAHHPLDHSIASTLTHGDFVRR